MPGCLNHSLGTEALAQEPVGPLSDPGLACALVLCSEK